MKRLKILMKLIGIVILSGIILVFTIGYGNYVKISNTVSIEDKVKMIQETKSYTKIEDISPYLIQATISIEDRRFYDHNGIDFVSLIRAFTNNLFAKGIVGGGSTITQQLAKNMFYSYNASYIRKISEFFSALDLEKELTKNEIIELYVNIINYGDNHMGVYEASMGYFSKMPSELTLGEASLLAGIPQSPVNFQLSNHLEEAKKRQKSVLEAMVRDGWITENEMNNALNEI